jgi:hypothetical protein
MSRSDYLFIGIPPIISLILGVFAPTLYLIIVTVAVMAALGGLYWLLFKRDDDPVRHGGELELAMAFIFLIVIPNSAGIAIMWIAALIKFLIGLA